jgi:hypothetical protein
LVHLYYNSVYRRGVPLPLSNFIFRVSSVYSTHHKLILESNSYVCSNDEAEVGCDDQWQAGLASQFLWTQVQLHPITCTCFINCYRAALHHLQPNYFNLMSYVHNCLFLTLCITQLFYTRHHRIPWVIFRNAC